MHEVNSWVEFVGGFLQLIFIVTYSGKMCLQMVTQIYSKINSKIHPGKIKIQTPYDRSLHNEGGPFYGKGFPYVVRKSIIIEGNYFSSESFPATVRDFLL